ncbi:hypothetical protein [Salinicoccus roseus]|uniref:hypothetical protein n=1 Tax=Salinicoccus roseus TaxID=45670 RepID=UPI0022FFF509|nr:hypothetical protein [Salinicoccus roseus]
MLNTYTHHCNGTCGERLDQQQKTIKAKNLHISRQSVALDKASRRIAELEKKEKAWDGLKKTIDFWLDEITSSTPIDEFHRRILQEQRKTVKDIQKRMNENESGESE